MARELWVKKASVPLLADFDQCDLDDAGESFVCGVGGCKAVLRSNAAYEEHYAAAHVNVCSVCSRKMPTCRLLSLHVQEAHDSFFAEMAKREPMYECLVEGCPKKFKGDYQRHWHLVNVHKYPKSFRFHFEPSEARKNRKRTSRSRKQKQAASHSVGAERPADEDQVLGPAAGEDGMDDADGARVCLDLGCAGGGEGGVDESEDPDVEMDSLCEGIRQLSTPAQIHFGRRREAGLSRAYKDARGASSYRSRGRGSGRGGDQRGGRGARMSGVGYGKAIGGIEMEDGDRGGGSVLP